MKKAIKFALISSVVLALLALLILYNTTMEVVHNPLDNRTEINTSPSDYDILNYETVELTTFDDVKLVGWYIPSRNGAAIIAQHGYKSDRTVMLNIASMLSRHGYGVIMIDLRAHGESEGDIITFGKLERYDVDAAYQYLLTRPEVDKNRIGAIGNSMGGATLIMYSADNPNIKAIAVQSSFAQIEDVAAVNIQQYTGLPPAQPLTYLVKLFVEQETGVQAEEISVLDSIGKISPRPILLMQGGQDEFIPINSGQRLFDAAGEPKELWFEPEQEHVFFDRDYPDEFENRVIGFFDIYLLEDD
ncbi:MAG: alpha/beta hydrolase [Ardenticatenaceae bacterium]|nr:alpha/beta hydrolase [Ardenticatenaceae bacterium]